MYEEQEAYLASERANAEKRVQNKKISLNKEHKKQIPTHQY